MTTEIEPETFNLQAEFLEEKIDPDSGLLDKLLSNGTLSYREFFDIKDQHPFFRRNSLLLHHIREKKKYDCLINAFRETKQTHLVNYLIGKGECNQAKFCYEWPLRESELSILDTNRDVLVKLIEMGELIGLLYVKDIINRMQRDIINSKPTPHEKNEAFLDILRRSNLRNFNQTIRCLRESNQSHIAQILSQGGVVIGIHATIPNERIEDEIIHRVVNVLDGRPFEESRRILEGALNIIAIKKGESIVLYVYCETVTQLLDLQEMQISGQLKKCIQKLFTEILSSVQNAEVTVDNLRRIVETLFTELLRRSQIKDMDVTLSEEEYSRCRSYFSAGIKLRAVFDFDPDEMTKEEAIELKNILRSQIMGLKDKENTQVKLKMNINKGQQEEKSHRNVEKAEVGDGKLDDDQSEEARSMSEEEEHQLKERAEEENLEETENEQAKSDSIMFEVETLHEPASILVNEKESKTELKDLEASSESESENSEKSSTDSKNAEDKIELEASSESQSKDSEISSAESEEESEELTNSYKMAFSFKKGDIMEAILPVDIGDTITWWRAIHLESGKVGYVLRRLIIIDYQIHLKHETSSATSQTEYIKSVTSDTSMSNLPFELLDSILQKSYLQRLLREEQVLKVNDYQTISQLASVVCCWFERIRRRKFKKELWRSLIVFYRRKRKLSSIYRINRQYLEENIRLKGLVNRLKSKDSLTDVQTASLYKLNLALGKKKSFKRFTDLISEVVKKTEAIQFVFSRSLCENKQHHIAEVIENGGAMTKVEIKLQKDETSVKGQHHNLHIAERIKEIRDKMKIQRSHQIAELMSKLKQDDLKILSAGQDGDVVIVWMQCKTKDGLEKLQTLNKSKYIVEFFTGVVKNLSFSPEQRNPAMVKPRVNIDFEQFEKIVVFFSIVANFTSRLDLRRTDEYVRGVTKLRNKIHVLLFRRESSSVPCCAILVFEDEIPFRLQKRIKIKEIEDPYDIASIEMENSLYVLDFSRCVWKIKDEGDEEERKEKIIKWLELRDYFDWSETLSMTRDGQLLLVGRRKDDPLLSLMIFGEEGGSEEGHLRLSIPLPKDIQRPFHAVETSKGNFIKIHQIKRKKEEESGSGGGRRQMEEEMNVVSELSGDGKMILRRFIPKNEEQKLSYYGQLAVDCFGRVFFSDNENDRVIHFDSDLQWKGILIPTEEDGKEGREIWGPWSLLYDEEKKELIVVGREEVFVYTLNRK